MRYEIRTGAEEAYVTVIVRADITREFALVFAAAAFEEALRAKRTGILVDMRTARSADGVVEKYGFAQEMASRPIPHHLKIACVTAPDDFSHDFVETTMRNRGFDVRFFRDLDEARAWLDPGPPTVNGRPPSASSASQWVKGIGQDS